MIAHRGGHASIAEFSERALDVEMDEDTIRKNDLDEFNVTKG